MEIPRVSIVIVTYNAEKYITKCLESILASRGVEIDKIIVVDNASNDNTTKLLKERFGNDSKIKVIELCKNIGFPLACNIGVAHANTDLVVLMNPDVIVDPYCFANLASFMYRDSEVAVAQPKILHPGGYIDSAGNYMDLLGHGFHLGKLEKDYGRYDSPREILYACFACAMVRRSIYFMLRGMDPRYFLYNEDLDFCWRCWLAGYRVLYVPKAVAYHIGHHASRKVPYHAIYFGRRNRLYTIFANYPLTLAVATTALLLALYIGLCIASSISDKYESRLMLKIIARFAKDLKYLARKRLEIPRRRSFSEFIERGLIVPRLVGLRLFLARFYRWQLGLSS